MTMPPTMLKPKGIKQLTAEEARHYGFDLEPDWMLQIDYEGEKPKYTVVSPDKWEFSDLVYGDGGEL